jgi:plastocyanin
VRHRNAYMNILLVTVVFIAITACSAKAISPIQITNPDTVMTIQPGEVIINLVAFKHYFDKNNITINVGDQVTIVLTNKDTISHSFSLYRDATFQDIVFRGDKVASGKTIEYWFIAPPLGGDYYFRDDDFPEMAGKLIVPVGC